MRYRAGLCLLFLAVAWRGSASAQTPSDPARKWEITDNSFLVEEAFNQEPGVFQNIFGWTRARGGGWEGSFTQEWPAPGETHQLSYTVPFQGGGGAPSGFSDVLINYRYQLMEEEAGRPAISPRLSLVLPTGNERNGLGNRTVGWQANVPVSKQFGDVYVHANGGITWIGDVERVGHAAASVIWRATPELNLMMESVAEFGEALTISPGLRRAWNVGGGQLVLGAAVPVTRSDARTTPAVLTYFSFERAFR